MSDYILISVFWKKKSQKEKVLVSLVILVGGVIISLLAGWCNK